SGVLSFRQLLMKLAFSKAVSRSAQSLRRPAGPGSCLRTSWHCRANCSRVLAMARLFAVERPVECGVLQFNPAAPSVHQVDRRVVLEPREHELEHAALAAEVRGIPVQQPGNHHQRACGLDASSSSVMSRRTPALKTFTQNAVCAGMRTLFGSNAARSPRHAASRPRSLEAASAA